MVSSGLAIGSPLTSNGWNPDDESVTCVAVAFIFMRMRAVDEVLVLPFEISLRRPKLAVVLRRDGVSKLRIVAKEAINSLLVGIKFWGDHA